MTKSDVHGKMSRHWSLACLLVLLGLTGSATDAVKTADRQSPDFVRVSLLWIGPGTEFFACAGHASLRLECPSHGLDYSFSCECESIREHPFRFVTGRLKTGLFAIPTGEFLQAYAQSGRGCRQYALTLPPDVKQRLWKILDDQVAAGRNLPYDYIRFCCVQTMLQPLLEAIRPRRLVVAPWPEAYRLTRREALAENLAWCPWTRLFLHTIAGTEVDREVDEFKRVILSHELVELLRGATIDGTPILSGEGEVLLPYRPLPPAPFFTPVLAGCVLLLLALVNLRHPCKLTVGIFLILQMSIGMLVMHLVLFSSLPATDWNWLIVPFNVFPVVFWKFRSKWAMTYCVILMAWVAGMIVYPHQITDPAYYLVVAACSIFHAKAIQLRREP